MTVRDDILAVLTDEFAKATAISKQVTSWSKISVRHTLRKLHDEGLIERRTEDRAWGVVHLYRRKPA